MCHDLEKVSREFEEPRKKGQKDIYTFSAKFSISTAEVVFLSVHTKNHKKNSNKNWSLMLLLYISFSLISR